MTKICPMRYKRKCFVATSTNLSGSTVSECVFSPAPAFFATWTMGMMVGVSYILEPTRKGPTLEMVAWWARRVLRFWWFDEAKHLFQPVSGCWEDLFLSVPLGNVTLPSFWQEMKSVSLLWIWTGPATCFGQSYATDSALGGFWDEAIRGRPASIFLSSWSLSWDPTWGGQCSLAQDEVPARSTSCQAQEWCHMGNLPGQATLRLTAVAWGKSTGEAPLPHHTE